MKKCKNVINYRHSQFCEWPRYDDLLYWDGCIYELQTSWAFHLLTLLSPEKDFFSNSFNCFKKLTTNDKNLEMFSIEKRKRYFYSFFLEKTSNIISKFNVDFSEDIFEVLYISGGPWLTPPMTFRVKNKYIIKF